MVSTYPAFAEAWFPTSRQIIFWSILQGNSLRSTLRVGDRVPACCVGGSTVVATNKGEGPAMNFLYYRKCKTLAVIARCNVSEY